MQRSAIGLTAILCAIALALAACSAPAPRPAPPVPTPTPAPPPPANVPAKPAVVAPKGPVVLGPRGFEEAKRKIKAALAKNPADALAADEVGYYVDVLQGRLKQVAGGQVGVVVGRQGNDIILDMTSRLDFDAGSARITPGIADLLAPIVKVLAEYRMMLVAVNASEDASSDVPVDHNLAQQRALGVARHLAGAGVAPARIVVAGSSAGHAVESPDSAMTARTRLEIHLEPIVRVVTDRGAGQPSGSGR